MNILTRPLWGFLTALILIAFTAQAQANDKLDVAVLNLESPQIDVAVIASLTAAMRDEATQIVRYNISQNPPISISELAILHGCDYRETQCLTQLAEQLGTQILIYGTTSHNADVQHVTVNIFDVKSQRIIHAFARDFDSNQNLAISFRREIAAFFANPKSFPTTRLEITSNVTGADIRIDGVLVGNTPYERLGLPPGTYRLEISAPGFETWTSPVTLIDSGDVSIKTPLIGSPGADTHLLADASDTVNATNNPINWAAWSLVGTGTVALGVSAAMAWMMSDTEQEIANRMGSDLTQNQHQQLINRGETYQLSHLVLLGVGAVGITSGVIWLLVDGNSGSSDAQQTSAHPVQFNISPSHVSAAWRW